MVRAASRPQRDASGDIAGRGARAHERVVGGILSSRGDGDVHAAAVGRRTGAASRAHADVSRGVRVREDRKSTRLNSSHPSISYAVFCLKKKKKKNKYGKGNTCEGLDDGASRDGRWRGRECAHCATAGENVQRAYWHDVMVCAELLRIGT